MPAGLVRASGSGLDPHLLPAGARVQVVRMARARQLPAARVQALVEQQIEPGTFVPGHLNVLRLNPALDALTAK